MIPELLAPAGSPDSLRAALAAGADAVYLGGTLGNARMGAANFDAHEICWAVSTAHERGVKVFITLNTLQTDRELTGESELLRIAEHCARANADAFIVQDLGLGSLLRKHFPNVELHASTQAAAHNSAGASVLHGLGYSRVIAARELDRANIALLVKKSPVQIEMFVHGALCFSYSGMCAMSHAFGRTRSANRGACAQPCRLEYSIPPGTPAGHALSLKELCLAEHIPELIESGVCSLKIEGRQRSPGYVYTAVSIYRRLLDERRGADPQELKTLADAFTRGGFTDGYYTGKSDKTMYGIRSNADIEKSRAAVGDASRWRHIPPPAGKGDAICCPPDNHPPKIFEHRTEKTRTADDRSCGKHHIIFPSLDALLAQTALLESSAAKLGRLYIPLNCAANPRISALPERLITLLGVQLPYICHDTQLPELDQLLRSARETGIAYALAENIGLTAPALANGFSTDGGAGLNITNGFAAAQYAKLGLTSLCLSPELKTGAMRDLQADIPTGAVTYGRLPLIVSENA
jgi:collagenase-like PrtC family protease